MKIEVEIPDGKYCGGCPFLQYRESHTVNMFGDYTGNVTEEIRCVRTGETLREEEYSGRLCHAKMAVKGMFCPAVFATAKDTGKIPGWAFPAAMAAFAIAFPNEARDAFEKAVGGAKENEGKEKH